ncbi:hypothetical protein EHQ61_04715 [Leptospira wolffii]|uniref:hypothetical protein n=1 Tax=Leptospira wolffii TaxID=409998 RepID=UPI0010847166|nr:hypothetical protein [Leptospira wolffii]TGL53169.1 hypothetical protein EHQ61_04715 [Leptospira wolffii]
MLKNIFITILFLFYVNCIFDPVWKARDELSNNKIPRSHALSEYHNAVLVKAVSCGPQYRNDVLLKGQTTLLRDECQSDDLYSSNYNEIRELGSCDNRYAYVDSDSLKTCLAEVMLSSCAEAGVTNVFIFPNFPSCSSLFNMTSDVGKNVI